MTENNTHAASDGSLSEYLNNNVHYQKYKILSH